MFSFPLWAALAAGPAAYPPVLIPLWGGPAPAAVGSSAADRPELTAYPVADLAAPAVVICPGGGYGGLAADHEGVQVAKFFNGLGVRAYVLKYRVAGKDRPGPLAPAPKLDVLRAVRLVRANAGAVGWGVDPKRVGLMGFSAGGHLASTGGTQFDAGDPAAPDPVDRVSSRPDFLILAYPVISMEDGVTHGGSRRNLLGPKPTPDQIAEYSNDKRVTKDTPPTFLFQTDEDTAVPAENAVRFYLALRRAKVPAELHVYEKGGHGIGLGRDAKGKPTAYAGGWPDDLSRWLRGRGIIGGK